MRGNRFLPSRAGSPLLIVVSVPTVLELELYQVPTTSCINGGTSWMRATFLVDVAHSVIVIMG